MSHSDLVRDTYCLTRFNTRPVDGARKIDDVVVLGGVIGRRRIGIGGGMSSSSIFELLVNEWLCRTWEGVGGDPTLLFERFAERGGRAIEVGRVGESPSSKLVRGVWEIVVLVILFEDVKLGSEESVVTGLGKML